MQLKLTPLLMFAGHAEEAMRFYTETLGDGGIERIDRYEAGEPGRAERSSTPRFVWPIRPCIASMSHRNAGQPARGREPELR